MIKYYLPFHVNNFDNLRKMYAEKYSYLTERTDLDTEVANWRPENFPGLYEAVTESLKGSGTFVIRCRFFITPPRFNLPPHVDGFAIDHLNYWALNVPIICTDSNHWQRWFEYNDELERMTNNTYKFSLRAKNPHKLQLKDNLVLTSPHFVNVGVFHDVCNLSDQYRIILSIRFAEKGLYEYVTSMTSEL